MEEGQGRSNSEGGAINARTQPDLPALRAMAAQIRRWIIERSFKAGVGHIASALSITDAMAVLWGGVMHRPGTQDPGRDRFLLGKGHAAMALYGALRYVNVLDEATFATYCQDGSVLSAHPEHGAPGVELATGSLGQALSVGCGLALGLRHAKSTARVFALISDGECNEGQVWEAAQFAGQHQLANLTAVLDANGLQCMGRTADVLDLSPLAEKWRAFRWHAVEVDGHDHAALHAACAAPSPDGRPTMVVARTVAGKGISFMEDRLEWHYLNMTKDQFEAAIRECEPQAGAR